jgi:hypothetical protein
VITFSFSENDEALVHHSLDRILAENRQEERGNIINAMLRQFMDERLVAILRRRGG